ncbi:DUF2800 domain-containing protein [Paenibacillus sp. TAB 01]|uniref:DUF2800 domain-containing protein n=1 Tax=Paenibacillus sp. TAB 01 TaxID=3368988 RepID=UPI0037525A5C
MHSHKERAHAKLSASGAERWMACTGSPQFEEGFENEETDYAKEGTLAHEISEILLRKELGLIDKRKINSLLKAKQKSELYSADMLDYVGGYVDYVMERVNSAKAVTPDAVVMLEQRLDFSEWVPDGFGTGDVVIVYEGTVEVIDLKYGQGVKKDAPDNPQLKLYGLGALNMYDILYDIKRVRMTIVQPRLDHISTDELTAFDLYDWAESTVRVLAEAADSGNGEYIPGKHCQFCRGRAACATRAASMIEAATEFDYQDPNRLTVEDTAKLLGIIDDIKKWCDQVGAYAYKQATMNGIRYPGYKLVSGKSSRKFTNIGTVKEILLGEGYEPEDILKPEELISLTDIEKKLKKKRFEALLGGCIERSEGKPALVPESDKRKELNTGDSARDDFADEL